jgi:hypothetical protein
MIHNNTLFTPFYILIALETSGICLIMMIEGLQTPSTIIIYLSLLPSLG